MEKGTNEEHSYASHIPVVSHWHQWNIQMPQGPSVHRHIPASPECIYIIGIPPVGVEISIGKLQQFANQI